MLCKNIGAASCGESNLQIGRTALMFAAVNGHADCVRLLIDAGAVMEAKTIVRRRSLLCCCASVICIFSRLLFSSAAFYFRVCY